MRRENKEKVKGEILHCRNCKKVKAIEYWMPLRKIWDDLELMCQKDWSKRELAPDYNSEKEGYYKHSYGICEECMQTDEKGIVLSKNHPLLRYWKAVGAFEKRANQMKNSLIYEYIMQISKIAADKINYKRFVEWKEKKSDNSLGEEDKTNLQMLASFFEKMGDREKDKKLSKLKRRILSREKEAAKFMESHNDITTYYILNDKNFSLNSRRVNIERMKRVCPNKTLTFGEFYDSLKYSEKVFLKEVNDRERFNIIKDDDLNEVLNWLSVTLQEIMKLLS